MANLASFQPGELISLAVNQVLGVFQNFAISVPYSFAIPSGPLWQAHTVSGNVQVQVPLGSFRDALTGTLQQVMPWLDGGELAEAATDLATIEVLKSGGQYVATVAGHKINLPNFTNSFPVHLGFWTTLVEIVTRPEMGDILYPAIQDFASSIKGNQNGLWDWLGGDSSDVSSLLQSFVANGPNSELWGTYAWEEPASKWNPPGGNSQNALGNPRTDYLLLSELNKNSMPLPLSGILTSWGAHWEDVLKQLANEMGTAFNEAITNGGKAIASFLKQLGFGASDIAQVVWSGVTHDLGQIGAALFNAIPDPVLVAKGLWNNVTNNLYDLAYGLAGGGLGLTLEQIATASYGVVHDLGKVADALWNSGAVKFFQGGYGVPDVVGALYAAVGRDLSQLGAIASAVYNNTTHNLYDLAYGLAGGGLGLTLEQIASALRSVGAGFSAIADALWNSGAAQFFPGGYGVTDVIVALKAAQAGYDDILSALEGPLGLSAASALWYHLQGWF